MTRLYRLLLKLYPARFREEYLEPMERQFLDDYGEARGGRARAALGLRALVDLAISIPAEIAREMRQDLRYAARVYRQRWLATLLAVAALALAIGVTTGVFSVVNALLIRSLPFRDAERLVEMSSSPVGRGRAGFRECGARSAYLEQISAYSVNEMNLVLAHGAARVRVAETTAGFMGLLGAQPALGRDFAAEEDIEGRDGVAVISYGLWQQSFGGDPRALGSTVRLNGVPMTVIGVAPAGLDYPGQAAMWTPTIFDLERLPKSGAYTWQIIGRLKPGISVSRASAMFEAETAAADGASRRVPGSSHLTSLRDRLAGPVRPASLVLMALVGFVLLIACANVAHLLLSRTSERHRELAVRAALGASRARLVQQMATEAMALTAVAAVAGMAVAYWTARLAASAQPAQLAARPYSVLDWRVIAFALGLAAVTGIVFGVLPASLIGRLQPGQDIMRMQPGSRGSGAGRMRGLLIAMQAALTVALAAGAFTMGRGFLNLLGTDLGYRTDGVVTLNVLLSGTGAEGRERQYYGEALARLRAVPGVESAAAVSYLPLIERMFMGGRFKLDTGQRGPMAVVISASPGYFRTMRTPVIEGREFTASDRDGAERVAIVNEDFARKTGVTPLIGRKIDVGWGIAPKMAAIVGIVRSERYSGPTGGGLPQVFLPIEQSPPDFVTFVAKVRGNAEDYLAVCRDAVQQTDRAVPVYDVQTLGRRLETTLARPRFYTTAIVFFAGFALVLAAVGIYGAAAHAIARRTHEIGVRIAVGASPAGIRAMLLGQSMMPVAAGMAGGIAAAIGLGRFLRHLIAATEPAGPWTCAAAALLLAATAAVAVWTATARVVRVDPIDALRVE